VEHARALGVRTFDGLALLEAQAVRQHELFLKVFDAT
jgi:shikimate 5-dehydrogenase